MKHRWVYGATQMFCLACPAMYRYTENAEADKEKIKFLSESIQCPTSEEDYQIKIKRLKESVKNV